MLINLEERPRLITRAGWKPAGPGCYDAVAIARAAGLRMLVMSRIPLCGDCPNRSEPAKRAAKISRKIVAGQQSLSGLVETRAELPFIGDQVVYLSHDQAARSGPASMSDSPTAL
jgi:hypothetical protein